MTLYQRYARLPIRFAELGLERGSERSSYFCTPRGARVIGWAGVDGIHFCFVPGHGDTVFAVSPMAAGDYVQVVARNFEDFLRLVLACGGTAAIEQARYWTRGQFDAFLASENSDYPPRTDALRIIRERLSLTPMSDPYGYLTALQREVDCSALQPREVPAAPEKERSPFPVVWNSSLHGRPRLRRAAKAVAVDAHFAWGDEEWCVPYLYVCAEGIMVDFCVGVETRRVKTFWQRYEALCGGDYGADLTQDQQEELGHNPLQVAFHSVLTINGVNLPAKSGSSTFWVPESCGSEILTEESQGTRAIVAHYGLDEDKAWVFWRSSYPWKGRRVGGVKSAALQLVRDTVSITAARFTDPAAGEEIGLVHPATGAEHVLRVVETGHEELDASLLRDPDTEYPTQFATLHGTVTPPLEGLLLWDCHPGDQPRSKNGSVCAIQVFGLRKGGDAAVGSGAVTGFSAPYFDPPESVTWRAVVQQKPLEDVEVKLI